MGIFVQPPTIAEIERFTAAIDFEAFRHKPEKVLAQMPKLGLFTDLQEQKRGIGLSLAMSGIVVLSGLGHL
ncbi:hypothetical protein [Nostoc sp. C117]|uniref:hypothetical protein n=1 Tax=Nostoc sp. C117 TaxID=3349875 RepID=UPI00370CFD36